MPESIKHAAILQSVSEELSLISSVVNNHVKSAKHQAGKKQLDAKGRLKSKLLKAEKEKARKAKKSPKADKYRFVYT